MLSGSDEGTDGRRVLGWLADFFGQENVPRKAVTMGVATILKVRKEYCYMGLANRS
jgi:hypothetical protein